MVITHFYWYFQFLGVLDILNNIDHIYYFSFLFYLDGVLEHTPSPQNFYVLSIGNNHYAKYNLLRKFCAFKYGRFGNNFIFQANFKL